MLSHNGREMQIGDMGEREREREREKGRTGKTTVLREFEETERNGDLFPLI
jgi:hypothetical protein